MCMCVLNRIFFQLKMRTGAVDSSSRKLRKTRSPKSSKRYKQQQGAGHPIATSQNNSLPTGAPAPESGSTENIEQTEIGDKVCGIEDMKDESIHDEVIATTPVTGLGTVVDIQGSFQVSTIFFNILHRQVT